MIIWGRVKMDRDEFIKKLDRLYKRYRCEVDVLECFQHIIDREHMMDE